MDTHLDYLFLCVFFWRHTHTHTHTHTHSEELSGLQSADAGGQLGVRRLQSQISRYEVTDGCVPSMKKVKKEMNTNLHSSRRCIHTHTATWNCIYIQSYTHTHTHTGSDSPQRADTLLCSASDGMWSLRSPLDWDCLYLQTTALHGRKLRTI